jgi:hypothetical protein
MTEQKSAVEVVMDGLVKIFEIVFKYLGMVYKIGIVFWIFLLCVFIIIGLIIVLSAPKVDNNPKFRSL